MRNAVEDEVPVRAYQAGDVDVLVINAQVIALADQPFDHFDHGALAQVVGSGFEAEAQHADLAVTGFEDQLQSAGNLHLIAGKNGSKNRQLEIALLGLIRHGAQILRQTGTAKGEPRLKVSGGDVELSILAEDFHDLVRIHIEGLAQVADLVREADFQRMPVIVHILDHLRGFEIGPNERRVKLGVQFRQHVSAGTVQLPDHRLG